MKFIFPSHTEPQHMDERAAYGSGATGPALGTNHVILIPPVRLWELNQSQKRDKTLIVFKLVYV